MVKCGPPVVCHVVYQAMEVDLAPLWMQAMPSDVGTALAPTGTDCPNSPFAVTEK